jgi:chromosome segregation ATPase
LLGSEADICRRHNTNLHAVLKEKSKEVDVLKNILFEFLTDQSVPSIATWKAVLEQSYQTYLNLQTLFLSVQKEDIQSQSEWIQREAALRHDIKHLEQLKQRFTQQYDAKLTEKSIEIQSLFSKMSDMQADYGNLQKQREDELQKSRSKLMDVTQQLSKVSEELHKLKIVHHEKSDQHIQLLKDHTSLQHKLRLLERNANEKEEAWKGEKNKMIHELDMTRAECKSLIERHATFESKSLWEKDELQVQLEHWKGRYDRAISEQRQLDIQLQELESSHRRDRSEWENQLEKQLREHQEERRSLELSIQEKDSELLQKKTELESALLSKQSLWNEEKQIMNEELNRIRNEMTSLQKEMSKVMSLSLIQ